MYDWMHMYTVNGLGDVEVGLYMKQMHTARAQCSYAEKGRLASAWFFREPARWSRTSSTLPCRPST